MLGHGLQIEAEAFLHHRRNVRQGVGVVIARLRIVTGLFLDVVTDAVAVHIGRAVSAAYANGVGLIAIAVAIAVRDVGTSAIVDGPWAVANAASVHGSDAVVHIVAQTVSVGVCRARAATDPEGVQHIAIAVAGPIRDVLATAVPGSAGAIANAAFINHADAFVHVIANAIGVGVGRAASATDTEGVRLTSIAIAVPVGDVGTAAIVDRAGSVAHPAVIERPHAGVLVVAHTVGVRIGCAVSTAGAQGVFVQTSLSAA